MARRGGLSWVVDRREGELSSQAQLQVAVYVSEKVVDELGLGRFGPGWPGAGRQKSRV